jgi:predicted dehydrogenase
MNGFLNRKLRMILIGGGGTGFIGKVHRVAATLDGRAEVVAGAFSSDIDRSRAAAVDFGVDPNRAFADYEQLLETEAARPEAERADFVTIATPNWLHFPMAKRAIEAGFHVVCDKPMTLNSEQGAELVQAVKKVNRVFAVTHNYTGYPLIRQAKQMIEDGELGEIRAVRANYIQGWMRGVQPGTVPARGAWKDDPEKNGVGGAIGDIGSHSFNLVRFVTGLKPAEVSARLMTFSPDRQLDDYGHSMVRFTNDAVAMITISQVTHGRLNDLSLEVDGDKAAVSWRQEEPNTLTVRRFGEPTQIYDRHPLANYTNDLGKAACRLPAGHPEAFFEAFANVYSSAFDDMIDAARDINANTLYPNVHDGLDGVEFIEKSVASSQANGEWLKFA